MTVKFKQQVIICPDRKREVEVTYTVSGSWFAPEYNIVACPAMYDSDSGCNKHCQSLLARSSSYEQLSVARPGWH